MKPAQNGIDLLNYNLDGKPKRIEIGSLFYKELTMRLVNTRFLISVLSAMLISMSACSSNTGNGALIGALTGAAIGKSTSNHHDKRAAIGAVIGGTAGAMVGNNRDNRAQYYQPNYQSSYRQQRYNRPRYRTYQYQPYRPYNYRRNHSYGHYYRP